MCQLPGQASCIPVHGTVLYPLTSDFLVIWSCRPYRWILKIRTPASRCPRIEHVFAAMHLPRSSSSRLRPVIHVPFITCKCISHLSLTYSSQFENPQFAALSTQACSICGRVLQGTSGPDRQSGMLEPEPAGQSSILPPLQNRHTKQNRDCHRRALMEQVGLCKPWQLPAPASGAAPCALYASAESRVRPYFSLVHGINWR